MNSVKNFSSETEQECYSHTHTMNKFDDQIGVEVFQPKIILMALDYEEFAVKNVITGNEDMNARKKDENHCQSTSVDSSWLVLYLAMV